MLLAYTGGENVVLQNFELSVLGYLFFHKATNLRERVFARLVQGIDNRSIFFKHSSDRHDIHPRRPELDAVMTSCFSSKVLQDLLAAIPFVTEGNKLRDPELTPWLQDLACIIAEEATQAYKADYFPGIPEISVPDEHVIEVMKAMQRELYREGDGGHRGHAVQLNELPWERQRALTERRRYWYGVYGITPENWTTGTFSLWDVKELPMPELRKDKK